MHCLSFLFTALAPLLGIGNAWISSKRDKGHFFSKDYTSVIKGLCCLIVIYVHINDPYGNSLQDVIGSFAYVCVTFFFLVSSYGMLVSYDRNKDYLKNFWRNRLVALLIPALLVNLVEFTLGSFNGLIKPSLILHLNGYVTVLLQWCLLYYVVMWCKNKWFPSNDKLADIILIVGVLVSSLYLYLFVDAKYSSEAGWCFERIGLIWGILLYRYYDGFVKWMGYNRFLKIVVLTVLGVIIGLLYLKFKYLFFWGGYLLKIVLGVVLLALLFTVTSSRSFNDKRSLWLGSISYEVYLSHGFIMGYLATWLPIEINSGLFIFLTVLVTIVLSALIHMISKHIVNGVRA